MTMDCGIRYVQAVDIADERAGDGFQLGGKVDRGHVRAAMAKQDDLIASIDGDESGDHENLIVHQQATMICVSTSIGDASSGSPSARRAISPGLATWA